MVINLSRISVENQQGLTWNKQQKSLILNVTGTKKQTIHLHPVEILILDMQDCYTWSFPEFVPFCTKLYYFSSFKDFNARG
jgi:hypothetical protein